MIAAIGYFEGVMEIFCDELALFVPHFIYKSIAMLFILCFF
jgi:hypothetical protein